MVAVANWPTVLGALVKRKDLLPEQVAWAAGEIVSGDATSAQIAAFVVGLRSKGETSDELGALVQTIFAKSIHLDTTLDAVDVVGTGGDQAHTVNISTMAAIIVAGAGIPVIKHGGRAASSTCGAADVLAELGIPLEQTAEQVERSAREVGIGFCFAPQFHSGLRHAAQARREIGIPTVFNFIAPLLNPAQPRSGAVGCSVESMAPVIAEVFAKRGCSVVVVRGEDGLDEVSTSAPTRMWIAADGVVRQAVVDVADLGIARALQEELRGGDAPYNASVLRSVLAGKPGPALDSSLINAATAIAAYRGVGTDVLASLRSGLAEARAAVETGAAEAVLARWVNFTATKD